MPLHGKIVVIKRSGGDGTEFPLTATCLFGRKPDCDIRIQLPQVSKEHCRIDLNENKEVILTNMSSVNPTRVNGEALQQSERLKHGDVITIIDRSFRFEYPPAPTPKKRSSVGGKKENFKVLQDQQVGDTVTTETRDKRISEVSSDPHLKDGTNQDNIQRSLDKTMDVVSKQDESVLQSTTTSPFNDLYKMIKQAMDVKTPLKSSVSVPQTPTSRFCTPKPVSVRKNGGNPVLSTEDNSNPKTDEAKTSSGGAENINGAPKSVKKQRKSFQVPSTEMVAPEAENPVNSGTTSPQKRIRSTPQRFTVCEVIEQVSAQASKSPMRRRSKDASPAKEQEKTAVTSPRTERLKKASPKNSGKSERVKEPSKKRKSGEFATDLPTPHMKRKRVSFGGHLSPELFDKRLPPDSPLRKGATPRRSLCLLKPKQSLLRRASVIGLLQEFDQEHPDVRSPAKVTSKKSPSAKNTSPKAATPAKKSPKPRTPSPKAATPAKKSPKSRSPSPKAATPAKKSPKPRTPSPKAATPAKKSPKPRTPSPKAATPAKKSPKSRSPSPKAATPAKKSPKSRTPSPKAATPAKKSPKSRTPSPKAATPAKKSPKSRTPSSKAATPAKKSPKSKSPSPAKGRSPSRGKVVTPGVQTPVVQGRFSVSRISTPSPVAEDAVADQVTLACVTPKLPLRRKSMKSTSRKTPGRVKSAVKAMCRRSGISRASMKAANSWADIVKFGQTKAQVAPLAKRTATKKTTKKAVSKPQVTYDTPTNDKTPARKLKSHVSTGHANSPATIVVGRAHKQKVVLPTGAAPRLVTNMALLKKNMKMDEDFTGISEMYKTPVNERKRRSVVNEDSAMKTPEGSLGTSVVEPSVLNTPEEPGEMMVSPLSVSSTVKDGRYNSEAVQRLFNVDQEASFVNDIPAVETHSDDSRAQQGTDVTTTAVTTPKQKPELPESLTGVKRIMKTPRQKAEPIEDLRGRLLKTPKQKVEPQECLTGVKRIMKTPRQKAEPVEDLRGNILKTPKQKPEQQECLSAVKMIFKTPQREADLQENPLEIPVPVEAGDASSDDAQGVVETPACMQESEDLSEMTPKTTPNVKPAPVVSLTRIESIMTPREKSAPVEDMVAMKRLLKTPREKVEPVEENFGIKRLMKSPRMRGIAPVEDFVGLEELMEEPLPCPTGQPETKVVEQTPLDSGVDAAKDASEVVHVEQVPSVQNEDESSEAVDTLSQVPVDDHLPTEEPKVDTVGEAVSEEQPEMATASVSEIVTAAADADPKKKSVRGRKAKVAESKSVEDKQEATEQSEDPVASAPARGRRGKKAEATAPPAVRQVTRGRNAKTTETKDVELAVEKSASLPAEVALKPKRGRSAKQASDEKTGMVQEVETVPKPEIEQSPAVDVDHKDNAASQEKPAQKPKRGRKAKQPEQSVPEEQDVPSTQSDDVPQAEVAKDASEVCSDQLEVAPNGTDENTPSDAVETVSEPPAPESLPEVEAATVQKKSVRGRRAKVVESKSAEDKQEATETSDAPVVPAPVRGRRGKKSEATAPPAVRQTTRGRNAKSQEGASAEQLEVVPETAVEATLVNEITTEASSDQTPPVNTHEEENDSAPPAEEVVVKPTRGRKTKQTPVEPPQPEPERNEASDELPVAEIPKSSPTLGKPRRGRKTKPDAVEQDDVADDDVEPKRQSQPPVRAKRGRNAQQEAKQENDGTTTAETTKSQEPVKKLRRTRKAEQDPVEPREEVQTIETAVPEEAEAPLVAEPVKMDEQAVKPKRGRKAKQDAEIKTPVEPAEVQEVPAVSATEKPKRGRRGKPVKEVEVTAVTPEEKPDQELEAEEKNNAETPVIKPSRARGVKTEVSSVVPAKRARRGAALSLEETNAESTVPASESAPAKRGRRAAAKPAADEATVTGPTEDLSSAHVEDKKMPKTSVKWKADVEVFEIPKVTPVKAVRGRRSKQAHQEDTESQDVSKDTSKPEEKDLSDQVAQPAKRARRGAKTADVTADKDESATEPKSAEAQPKPRRGRPAKK